MGFDKDSSDYGDQAILPLHNIITDPITPANQATVDATGALKVTGGGGEEHTDGEIVQAGDKGSVAIGSDGTNYQFLKVDSDGNLQIDVITLPQVDISNRADRDLGKVDIAAFDSALPIGDNVIGRTKLTDGTNVVDILNDSGTYRLQVAAKMEAGGALQNVVITDPDVSAQQAAVDTSGRLLVSTQPVTPITSLPVSGVADGNHSGAVTTYFTLDATKTTTVQRFICGGEGKKYTKVELHNDPNGTGVGMILLAKGFLPEGGGNFTFDLNEEYVGNGTRRLAIIRTCSNSTETFAKWSGFEV